MTKSPDHLLTLVDHVNRVASEATAATPDWCWPPKDEQ